MQPRDLPALAFQIAERIQQAAMGGNIKQAAIVRLAMHFQQQAAQIFEQADADRLVIDEGAGFAVGGKAAAQHDLAVMRHRLVLQQGARAMIGRRIEHRCGGALGSPGAYASAATPADREPQGIQQDGFARPGFAGQDIEAGGEFQRGLFDQHDVADRQRGKHRKTTLRVSGGKLG